MRTLHARPALLASLVVGVVAMMGLGFALWSETLDVNATVSTGELNMSFFAVSTGEDAHSDNPTNNASCAGAGLVSDSDINEVAITFSDAFPGFSCIVRTGVENIGTVDAVLARTEVSGDDALLFNVERLYVGKHPLGGAANGQVYADGPDIKKGPSWRVTFRESNDNNTESHTGKNAYKLTLSTVFKNAAP